MASVIRFFTAKGNVQKVNFRQTIVRGALKRNLKAGASNDKTDKNRVEITLSGDTTSIDEMISVLKQGKLLNDWGAKCTEVVENPTGMDISAHKVNTDNVDTFKWGKVEFYL